LKKRFFLADNFNSLEPQNPQRTQKKFL
jgi:hypothetical protein